MFEEEGDTVNLVNMNMVNMVNMVTMEADDCLKRSGWMIFDFCYGQRR